MRVREAAWEDRAAIRTFCCTPDLDGWSYEVEQGLRTSLSWRSGGPHRRVTLLVDEHETVLAIARYRPFFITDVPFGWTIEVLGVRLERQGEGFGTMLMQQILWDLREVSPGGIAGWFVHVDNAISLRVAEKLGCESAQVEPPPDDHVARVIRIPAADAQAPDAQPDASAAT